MLFPDGKQYVLWLNNAATSHGDIELMDLNRTNPLISSSPQDTSGTWVHDTELVAYRSDTGQGYWQGNTGTSYWSTATRDGRFLIGETFCANADTCNQYIDIYDNMTNSYLYAIKLPAREEVDEIALGSDSNTLVVATNRDVFVWDIAQGRETAQFALEDTHLLRISSDADIVVGEALGQGSEQLVAITVASGKVVSIPIGSARNDVTDIALSPDGKTMATIDDNGTVILRNTRTLREVADFAAPQIQITHDRRLTFSPDGTFLASYGLRTITLWNVISSDLYAQFTNRSDITNLIWTTGGDRLVWSESYPTAVQTLEIDSGLWHATICSVVNRNLSEAEWKQYVGNARYTPICARLPAG